MPRPPCRRKIGFIPNVVYFKPAGIPFIALEEVIIGHDELEALRLKDLMGMAQDEAAQSMGISQPTLHRLLISAHQKIADAIINGKAIRVEGGNVEILQKEIIPCGMGKKWMCREDYYKSEKTDNKNLKKEEANMKIAITSADGTMEGMVDERFGRAKKIIIYDMEKNTWSVVDNAINFNSPQGAGIQTAQNVINAGASIVISGHLGPKAYRVLTSADVNVYTASNMKVSDAITAFKEGRLNKLTGPDVEGHW